MKQDERETPGRLYRVFPFLDWLKGYQLETFKDDSIAGITVAVVLIPQAMAYAMLAGMPAVYGLYAAAVTPFIALSFNNGEMVDYGANYCDDGFIAGNYNSMIVRVGILNLQSWKEMSLAVLIFEI